MNYVYCVGYSTYEESEKTLLSSKTKFSQEEFNELISRISVGIIENKYSDEHAYVKNFQDIFDDVVEVLIKTYGFTPIKVDAYFRPFGWASIFNKEDWKDSRDAQLDKVTDALNKAGFTKDIKK